MCSALSSGKKQSGQLVSAVCSFTRCWVRFLCGTGLKQNSGVVWNWALNSLSDFELDSKSLLRFFKSKLAEMLLSLLPVEVHGQEPRVSVFTDSLINLEAEGNSRRPSWEVQGGWAVFTAPAHPSRCSSAWSRATPQTGAGTAHSAHGWGGRASGSRAWLVRKMIGNKNREGEKKPPSISEWENHPHGSSRCENFPRQGQFNAERWQLWNAVLEQNQRGAFAPQSFYRKVSGNASRSCCLVLGTGLQEQLCTGATWREERSGLVY